MRRVTIASSSPGETVVRNLNFNSTILVESLLFRYIHYPLLLAQGSDVPWKASNSVRVRRGTRKGNAKAADWLWSSSQIQ